MTESFHLFRKHERYLTSNITFVSGPTECPFQVMECFEECPFLVMELLEKNISRKVQSDDFAFGPHHWLRVCILH